MQTEDNILLCISAAFPSLKISISSTSFFQTIFYLPSQSIRHIFRGIFCSFCRTVPQANLSFQDLMDNSYLFSTEKALQHFKVNEHQGLSEQQVQRALEKYGRNGTVHRRISNQKQDRANVTSIALPEDPPTPLWQLILEQFKDQLVIILLGSAAISFVLALFEDGEGWTAFVDPAVVSTPEPTK